MTKLGPPPLALRLPADLAAAEPTALRRRASEHGTDAAAAADSAKALRAAVVRLVPAAWLGLGALSFAAGALLQAESLEGIAQASNELAQSLLALADVIEQARAEAAAAVRSSRRLDDEVAADDARWSSRPEPERADPDPVRLAAQFDEARRLRTALAVASQQADAAWRRASAAFDLVAYRMPALAARMSGADQTGWRPTAALSALPVGQWRRLVGASPVCVAAGYLGAGGMLGPDGRRYPLVVPWVSGPGDVRWTGDLVGQGTTSLDGADPGWHEVGVRVGIDSFGPAASTATKAAVITAGLAGNAPQMIGRLRPDLLSQLRWSANGVPSVGAAPPIPPPRRGGTGQIPRSALVQSDGQLRWVADTSKDRGSTTRAATRADPAVSPGKAVPGGPNVVALADSGLSGLSTARRLDDGRTAAYRATFEENDDGRIRARLTTYQIRDGRTGPSVLATDVSLSPDGELRREPVRYRPAPSEPGLRSARG